MTRLCCCCPSQHGMLVSVHGAWQSLLPSVVHSFDAAAERRLPPMVPPEGHTPPEGASPRSSKGTPFGLLDAVAPAVSPPASFQGDDDDAAESTASTAQTTSAVALLQVHSILAGHAGLMHSDACRVQLTGTRLCRPAAWSCPQARRSDHPVLVKRRWLHSAGRCAGRCSSAARSLSLPSPSSPLCPRRARSGKSCPRYN